MRLGVVYLPDPAMSARISAYARKLVEGRDPRAVLGPNALPHVTLVHVETERDAGEAWEEVRTAIPPTCALRLQGLALFAHDKEDAAPATMAWLVVTTTEALRDAERRVLATRFAHDGEVRTHNGDEFQPHATLAIWEGRSFPREIDLGMEASCEGRLALGAIGAHGVYLRTLFGGAW